MSTPLACGAPEAGASPGSPPASMAAAPSRGPVCPGCVRRDVAGTETSDFSGSEDPCTGDRAPLPTAPDALAQINRLREAYTGPLELSLRSGSGSGFDVDALPPSFVAPPAGYEPQTRVRIDVTLGDTEYFVGRLRSSADLSIECADWFRVPATLALSTEDGALEATAEGDIVTRRHGDALAAHADLADVVGTLDLHLDPSQTYRGGLSIQLLALNEGIRGGFELSVGSAGPPEGPGHYPLGATFPDDGCDWFSGFPIAADAPLHWAGEQSTAQLLGDWEEALSGLRIPSVWPDCSPVDVSVEVGAAGHVCAGSSLGSQQGHLRFDAASHLLTSDGRIDMALTVGHLTPLALSLEAPDPLERIPAVDFATRSGVLGVDAGNSPWLTAWASATFRREGESIVSDGTLRVEGLDCRADDCNAYVYRETLDWGSDLVAHPGCE